MISPNPFFYNKSSKYCYGSECDLMNDVNSSNSSNLRNTVLSVNCRLYIAAKFLLVCDPIFFMNKYDTLKNWWVPIQLTFNQNSMYQVRLSRGIVCFKILISEGKKTTIKTKNYFKILAVEKNGIQFKFTRCIL